MTVADAPNVVVCGEVPALAASGVASVIDVKMAMRIRFMSLYSQMAFKEMNW
jgi:hypothetical protein